VNLDDALARESYCYLTTTGRVTAKPHTIEIWFGLAGDTLYMLSGGGLRPDWVQNLQRQPAVSLRIGERTFAATARLVSDPEEDALARRLLVDKYQPGYGSDLTTWGRTSLPIAFDLQTA
jgi:deazaflavin-dependent oxidoreductase (nitroreductase family)